MNRILASYKKIFSLVQEHSVVSALVLLLVLLSPLAGLDAVQTMGDQIFHAAVIEGYEVFDGNCQLTESAITQRTGRSQHLAFLEEKISHERVHPEILGQTAYSHHAQTRQLFNRESELQAGPCGYANGKYAIRAQQGRFLLTFLGQPIWSVTRILEE